jgi:multicomponent Na+:H+ antiporter subunit G
MIELGASFLVLIGSFFVFSAAVGLLRMPDAVSRIQTGTKATTLGACLILAGLAVLHPERSAQYVLLIVFVFISNPISSHALARAGLSLERKKREDAGHLDTGDTAK